MAAGQLVFPVVIVGFLAFFGAFLLTTPATPAPQVPGSQLARVGPGDTVTLEVTGFYGPYGNGWVFFSTQEERRDSLPQGDLVPQFQDAPVVFQVSDDANETKEGLDAALIGKRVGAAIRTPPLEPRLAFGDWEEDRSFQRVLTGFPYDVRFDSQTQFASGQSFNVTAYLEFWARSGTVVEVGSTWACEDARLWDCRVTQLDRDANVLAYRRLVDVGQTYPVLGLFGNLPTAGDFSWNVSVQPGADDAHFNLRFDPSLGTRFQVRQTAAGPFEPGTYLVQSLGDDEVKVRYSSATGSNPRLVGEPVYYDLVIVKIEGA